MSGGLYQFAQGLMFDIRLEYIPISIGSSTKVNLSKQRYDAHLYENKVFSKDRG